MSDEIGPLNEGELEALWLTLAWGQPVFGIKNPPFWRPGAAEEDLRSPDTGLYGR